jgi:mycothiol synthase
MSTIESPSAIELPFAPAVDGLVIRHAADDDWAAMADVHNAARRGDGVDEVRSTDSLRSEHAYLEDFRLDRDVVVALVHGRMVAYAMGILIEREGILVGEMWGAVRPEDRHQGIGTALWRSNRDRLAAAAAADPRPGQRELRSYALDIEAADLALIADQGYVPIRYGFEMRRFLTGSLPERPLPDGLELRRVRPEEHRAIWEADAEAFRDHWGHREQTEGKALGVKRGWLEHVSVRRPWRGRGLGKALCADAFRVLRDRGMDEAWLGVDGTNPTGALQLYEGLGFGVVRRWNAFGRPMDGPAPEGWTSGSESTA